MEQKIIFSGIQPSGSLTLGNYMGALKNWVALQQDPSYHCIYCVVDQHAITVRQEPADLRRRSVETFALLCACGLDPSKSTMFIQSHVPEHTQLAWVLACNTQFGELARMTQFKDKSARHKDNINAGLFTYPVLMAADILLYGTHLVPVGADQKQHLELSRDVALRFNANYSETFVVPEPYIKEVGGRIMSLADPTKKMSKSDSNENAYITLLDEPDMIIRKFKRAVTDSDAQVLYRDDKPGIQNLMGIYAAATGKSFDEIEREFDGRGYGDFKVAVGESVSDMLRPIREGFAYHMSHKEELEELYSQGALQARRMARKMLQKVYRKVGFTQPLIKE